jgi:ScaI restriction endonuclease
MTSPYTGVHQSGWAPITRQLVQDHPLETSETVDVVLASWNSIFDSVMGTHGFKIGKDIWPGPQIMGFFLHEFIPLELGARHPGVWRRCNATNEKDIVHIPDDRFSVEVKTSSNKSRIFGNRSYAQEAVANKKDKSGYYLAVNFEKFRADGKRPRVLLVRFGWIDSTDWRGQAAATGQQASLAPDLEAAKLLELYRAS